MNKPHAFWKKRSDKKKIEVFGHNDKKHVQRSKGEGFKLKITVPAVKYCGGRMLQWME